MQVTVKIRTTDGDTAEFVNEFTNLEGMGIWLLSMHKLAMMDSEMDIVPSWEREESIINN